MPHALATALFAVLLLLAPTAAAHAGGGGAEEQVGLFLVIAGVATVVAVAWELRERRARAREALEAGRAHGDRDAEPER